MTNATNTTHTPQPWLLDTDRGYARVVFGPAKKVVAHIPSSASADADADLIKAAPKLLAALKQCRGQWIHSANAPACLAAIAEAEGGGT